MENKNNTKLHGELFKAFKRRLENHSGIVIDTDKDAKAFLRENGVKKQLKDMTRKELELMYVRLNYAAFLNGIGWRSPARGSKKYVDISRCTDPKILGRIRAELADDIRSKELVYQAVNELIKKNIDPNQLNFIYGVTDGEAYEAILKVFGQG